MIQIRPIQSMEDYQRCVDLQQRVWGFTDRDLLPARFLKVSHMSGGSVLGAFAGEDRLVGFAYAQASIRDGRPGLHSNILAVDPEFRNLGVGVRLKLEQRREALSRGISVMTWTFDPMQARNAYLNLNKLGAVAGTFHRDLYGTASSSRLHSGLGTDRVIAEWWLDSPRVTGILDGSPLGTDLAGADGSVPTCILRWVQSAGRGELESPGEQCGEALVSLEIPTDVSAVMEQDLELARDWRLRCGELMESYFSRGYRLVRVARPAAPEGSPEETRRTFYILEACEDRLR